MGHRLFKTINPPSLSVTSLILCPSYVHSTHTHTHKVIYPSYIHSTHTHTHTRLYTHPTFMAHTHTHKVMP